MSTIIGVGGSVLTQLFTTFVVALFGALGLAVAISIGLAFGLRSRDFVAENIDDWAVALVDVVDESAGDEMGGFEYERFVRGCFARICRFSCCREESSEYALRRSEGVDSTPYSLSAASLVTWGGVETGREGVEPRSFCSLRSRHMGWRRNRPGGS
ncbi:hypothetical protein [Halolamina sp.]|uniref:hypothetical protein n=1 Tax=Halolamina sp. TaxID=1940283 RepID=UPI0035669658